MTVLIPGRAVLTIYEASGAENEQWAPFNPAVFANAVKLIEEHAPSLFLTQADNMSNNLEPA